MTTKEISNVDISIKSNYELMPFKANIFTSMPGDDSNFLFWGGSLSQVLASDKQVIKSPYTLNLGFSKVFDNTIAAQAKLSYESQSYILLRGESSGISTTSVKTLFMDFKLEKRAFIFNHLTRIGFHYSSSLLTASDLYDTSSENAALRSTRYGLIGEANIYSRLYLQAGYQYLQVYNGTSNDFTVENNIVFTRLIYR